MAAMRSIGVRLRLYTDEYKRDAGQAVKANEAIGESGQKAKRDLDGLSTGMAVVGTLLVAAAAAAVYATAKFDKQMSEVKAVSGATADEFRSLRQAALDAGAATVFSATEAAAAEAELAKAGVKTADILGGALTGALALAAAGTLDLATAATISAAAMNTFSLKGQDVGHIADVLAAASNKSAASVEDLGLGLQQVGLVAAQVGFTLEETVGLLAAFADRGLRGSDGATSLKTALLRLAAPEREAAAAMERYNISLYDANGNMVDAANIAGQLQRGLGNLSAQERNAALSTIFGSDAIRAANILYSQGEKGIRDYIDAVNDQGAAARVAAEKMDNLSGDVEKLTGSLETLFITSGEGASTGLRYLVQAINLVVDGFARWPKWLQSSLVLVAGLTGLALLLAAGLIKLRTGIAATTAQLVTMGRAGQIAATGLRLATTAAGYLAAALVIASLAMEAFGPAVEHGGPRLARYGETTGDVAKANIQLAGAFGEAASRANGLREAFDKLNNAALTNRAAIRDAEEAVDDLADALKASNGSLDVTTEEGREAAAAVDALAIAAAQAAQAAYDAAVAAGRQSTAVDEANAAYQRYIDQLRAMLRNAGMSEQAVEDLISQIAKMPEYKALVIDVQFRGLNVGFPGGVSVMKRWGGIDHAAQGMVRRPAQIATRPTVWFAEPETGGEAYVPKRGNYSRSMGILSEAAGWYGADVVPRGAGDWSGGGGGAVEVRVSLAPGADGPIGRAIEDRLRFEVVQVGGGSVQSRYGQRGRIG